MNNEEVKNESQSTNQNFEQQSTIDNQKLTFISYELENQVVLSYEECKDFFDVRKDPLSTFRSQQIEQAITKAKKPQVINVDDRANTFLKQYIRYQKDNYPSLDLSTKEDKNGWWTDYRTELGTVYINHKIQEGFVDLTFPKASEKTDRAKIIADWARQHKIPDVTVIKTKKSAIGEKKLSLPPGFWYNTCTKGESQISKGEPI